MEQDESQLQKVHSLEHDIEEKRSEVARLQEELSSAKELLQEQSNLTEQLKEEKLSLKVKVTDAEQQIQGTTVQDAISVQRKVSRSAFEFLLYTCRKCC